jgi:hypothetical protein
MADENQMNLAKLQSLFHNQKHFQSAPDIHITSPTNDGRVSALILFNDPRDVTKAMEMYEAPDDPDLFKFGTYKLRLVPLLDHSIELNSALSQAIPNKIKQTVDKIKNDPEFSNLRLIQKCAVKNKQDITRITINGNNILQIYKARTIFDELMKGKIFKFNSPSWVRLLLLLFIFFLRRKISFRFQLFSIQKVKNFFANFKIVLRLTFGGIGKQHS